MNDHIQRLVSFLYHLLNIFYMKCPLLWERYRWHGQTVIRPRNEWLHDIYYAVRAGLTFVAQKHLDHIRGYKGSVLSDPERDNKCDT